MLASRSRRPTVLIADDDAATRFVMASTLTHEGFRVTEAASGQEAIDVFAHESPDVILMDVEMPGTDGFEACESIRSCDGGKDIPIVMVTGHDDSESIDRAFDLGATDFISKPINWSLIGHRLRYILRGAAHVRSLAVREAENRALVAAIPDCIFIVDGEGIIQNNLSRASMTGTSDDDPVGKRLASVLPVHMRADVNAAVEAVVSTGENTVIEYWLTRPDGSCCWFESRFVKHVENRILVINRDISERKRAEEKIHKLAYFDPLTGLPNRPLFKERFESILEHARQVRGSVGIFNIDLNRFKRINDTLGSSAGDAVLMRVADRLSRCLDEVLRGSEARVNKLSSCLGCFGGNEFALVLGNSSQSFDYAHIAEELRRCVAKPLIVEGSEFVVTCSVGAAVFPDHGASVEVLLKNAECATNEAKHVGANTQKFYRSSMNSGISEGLNLENELRRALENDELSVLYQPKFCTKSLEHRGAEALIRWNHPQRGEILPSAFIPIAEESGLISDIGAWVAETVCEQIASWQYFGIESGPIAINISGQEFGLGDVVSNLTCAVSKAGICASALELEITETVLMSDIRSVMHALHALREIGFSLAVDDFGTGYSSLRYLQKFPVDVLKIDSSFIRNVERSSENRAICTAIIAMARSLGLKIVAEGVENRWQLEFLKRESCDTAQGFLLSQPLAVSDYMSYLRADTADRCTSNSSSVVRLSSRMMGPLAL